jgi:hypothetical protein
MRLKDFITESGKNEVGDKLGTLKAAMRELNIKTKLPSTGYTNEERLQQAIQAWNIGTEKGPRWGAIGDFMMGLSTSKELSAAHTALSKSRNILRRAESAIPGGLLPSDEMSKLDAAMVHMIDSLRELPDLMKTLNAFFDIFTALFNEANSDDEFRSSIANAVMGNLGLRLPEKSKS